MKILVDRLSESPKAHPFCAPPAWWREAGRVGAPVADALAVPVTFRVDAHRMGNDVFLTGAVSGELELECSRCVAPFRRSFEEEFRLVLEPARDRVPADPEGAAALARDGVSLSDELESGWFRGSEIDLGGFLQEIVALLLPVQPLCREDCRGLCPRCGVDRNLTECSCREASRDSPFAVLGPLRDQLEGRNR